MKSYLRKKIKNKIRNPVNISILKTLIINSNHPRRVFYYLRYYLKRISITTFGDSSDDAFYKRREEQFVNHKGTLILYVGDSHVEYLSRINVIGGGRVIDAYAFWLGPITRMGYVSVNEFEKVKKAIERIIRIRKILNKEKVEKIVLVWCAGSIDIRCSFYELLLSQSFESTQELFKRYEESTSHLIKKLMIPMLAELKIEKAIMLSSIDSELEGKEPKKMKEIREIRKIDLYPTLGLKTERKKWREETDEITKKLCEINRINFLDVNSFLISENRKFLMPDGIHVGNPQVIARINKEILDL